MNRLTRVNYTYKVRDKETRVEVSVFDIPSAQTLNSSKVAFGYTLATHLK